MFSFTVHKSYSRKAAAALMLFAFICQPTAALAASIKRADQITGGNGGGTSGDFVYVGSFWQSNASGYTPTGTFYNPEAFNKNNWNKDAMKWRVLSDNNGRLMMVSDEVLYESMFDTRDNNQWGACSLRKAMNSTAVTTFNNDGTVQSWGGFGGDAFSTAEYSAIAETTHRQEGAKVWGGNTQTTEKIYLLGVNEASKESYGFIEGSLETIDRKAYATLLAQKAKMYGCEKVCASDTYVWWHLRSPASIEYVYEVTMNGNFNDEGVRESGIRPVIEMENILFATAAQGGKSSVKIGDGFTLPEYTGREYKLTLQDADIAAPAAVSVTQKELNGLATIAAETKTGGTIDLRNGVKFGYDDFLKVTYTSSAIVEGKADYVSAIVADTEGNYVNYAKISDKATEQGAYIPVLNLNKGTYKVYIFAERIGGTDSQGIEYTDYASNYSSAYDVHVGSETKYETLDTALTLTSPAVKGAKTKAAGFQTGAFWNDESFFVLANSQ